MQSHPFDAISAFFGAVYAGIAALVLASDEVLFDLDADWIGPAVVVLLGLALLLTGLRSGRRRDEAVSAVEPGEVGVAAADDDADPAAL